MKIFNYTPHPVTINGVEYHPTAKAPRLIETIVSVKNVDEIKFSSLSYGQVENLPEPEENTILIVSALVAQALPERQDLAWPFPLLRDETGRVVGASGLAVCA